MWIQAVVVKRTKKVIDWRGLHYINHDFELSGDKWSLPEIDWWYFSSITKPTLVSQSHQVGDEDDTEWCS